MHGSFRFFTRARQWMGSQLDRLWWRVASAAERVMPGFRHWDVLIITGIGFAFFVLLHWLSDGRTTPLIHVVGSLGTYALAFLVPYAIIYRHARRQDRLLDRIRGAFIISIEALNDHKLAFAKRKLNGIRRMERRWRWGASAPYRWSLRVTALVSGVAFGLTHFAFSYLTQPNSQRDFQIHTFSNSVLFLLEHPLPLALSLLMSGLIGFVATSDTSHIQGRPWSDFYGDRLAQAIIAGRGINLAPQHEGPELPPDGATAREILGLGQIYSKFELRNAWIRLARELHPDKWASEGIAVQRLKEAALKRVNNARDELEPYAR